LAVPSVLKRKKLDSIYFDMTEVFDKVPKDNLLAKLCVSEDLEARELISPNMSNPRKLEVL